MLLFKRFKIRSFEMGLYFHDGEFRGLLGAGTHWFCDLFGKVAVEIVSRRAPFLSHEKLDLIAKSGELKGHAEVLDLKDDERALVWVDRRFAWIAGPGQCAYWTEPRQVRVELVDARRPRFEHEDLKVICRHPSARDRLEVGAVGAAAWACSSSMAATPTRWKPARGRSGRALPTFVWSRSTFASRRSTFRARKSLVPTR